MSRDRADALSARAAELVAALPVHDPDDERLYRAIDSALAELVGYKLLTVLRLRGDRLWRLHSSDPVSYPAGGHKDIHDDLWLRTMLAEGRPVISGDPAAVQARFVDHVAIFALGCGAVMNLPVTGPTGTQGSLNLLHQAQWFTAEHLALAQPFAEVLARRWSAASAEGGSAP